MGNHCFSAHTSGHLLLFKSHCWLLGDTITDSGSSTQTNSHLLRTDSIGGMTFRAHQLELKSCASSWRLRAQILNISFRLDTAAPLSQRPRFKHPLTTNSFCTPVRVCNTSFNHNGFGIVSFRTYNDVAGTRSTRPKPLPLPTPTSGNRPKNSGALCYL